MAGKWGVFARFVAFALACALGFVFLANTMANRINGGSVTYTADFTNVSGLRPGDDVRAAGVKVGRVNDVKLHGSQARVTFEIADDQPVTTTTTLTLRYQSLLGQRYLALSQEPNVGPGKPLADGTTISTKNTSPGFDLTALLNGFEPLFATLKPDEVNQLAESLIAVLQGQGGTVESFVTQAASLTNRLADQEDVIATVLDALTPVLQNVSSRSDQVESTLTEMQALFAKLAEEREELGGSLDAVSKLSDSASELLAEARGPLRHDIQTMRTFSRISVEQAQAIEDLFTHLPTGSLAFARPFSSGTWLHMYICNMAVEVGSGEVNIGPANGPYSAGCS